MVDADAPVGLAAVWEKAARVVGELRRDDLSGDALTAWNGAIALASEVLEKEGRDVREMARMAHLLIVGNVRG
jgi:hypothetical protein